MKLASDVQMMSIDKIIPYHLNSKTHPEAQIDKLASMINEYGWDQPIVVDANFIVIKGHGRLLAAKKLGMSNVPVIVRSDLSEAKVRASRIADNKIAETDWDTESLLADLKILSEESDELLRLTGFDDSELDEILKVQKSNPGDGNEDDIPEVPQNVRGVQRGQIWQLGDHRLMCGDSTSKDDVDRLMGGEKADMVFTDPPYGMNLDTDFGSMNEYTKAHGGKTATGSDKLKRSKNVYKPVINDDKPFDATFLIEMADEVLLWGADYYKDTIPAGGSWFVWDKKTTDGLQNMFGSDFELCWSKNPHSRKILRYTWAGCFGFDKKNDGDKRVHPTQKPVTLCAELIGEYSQNKGSIADLFLGSGSTLIACEKTNRKCFGLEIDPHYCSVIIERWEKYTGRKAQLVNS